MNVTINCITTIPELARALATHRGSAVWAYCRVSSDKQEAEGLSLQAQMQAVEAYCKEQEIPLCMVVQEVKSAAKPCFSISLSSTSESTDTGETSYRPLFSMLLSGLTSGERNQSTLIVWKLDRLSRVLHEQEFIFELLQRHEIKLVSLTKEENNLLLDQDPTRLLIRQILGALAQYERALIRLRVDAGIRAKAALGGWLGGRIPFGYRAVKGDLVIDEDEAKIVRQIFHLRDFKFLSFAEIARLLRENSHGHWYRMRVRRIILNRLLYSGIYVDRFDVEHVRPDLRILSPEKWDARGKPILEED